MTSLAPPAESRWLALAAGGTGGHVFPAIALASELDARGWPMVLYTDARGERYSGARPAVARQVVLPVAGPRNQPVHRRPLELLRHLAWGLRLTLSLRHRPPACLVAFGGYACVPALLAASLLRVPRLVHEQNTALGQVSRVFRRLGAEIVYGLAPPPGEEGRIVGNPLREAVCRRAGETYRAPEAGEAFRLLVVGGSQGSRALAHLISAACAALEAGQRARLDVVCQARSEDCEVVRERFASAGVRAQVEPFFTDLPDMLAQCHLVAARAGASTLSEIAAIGRPAILLPLPTAANDHQTGNACMAVECGAARMRREGPQAVAELAEDIAKLMESPQALEAMAQAAASCARPDAASALADLVERRVR